MTTISLQPEDLVGQIARSAIQAEPVDIDRGVSRSGDISRLGTDDKGVGMAGLTGGSEVPLGGKSSASSVRDEVMLSENGSRMQFAQSLDHLGGCPRLGCDLPCVEGQFGYRRV